MKIFGIETSCDETAAAVVEGQGDTVKVLSNTVSSQIEIHKKYGGVVPEVAAREHVLSILPVVDEALAGAELRIMNYELRSEIDAIAVTVGPGLITSLLAGIETAKALSYAWNIPLVGVNHIEGHIYANFIGEFQSSTQRALRNIKFPIIILTVSGGHTMLVLMEEHGKFKTIGETRDDAAGEAFDKAAKLMGIGYPGGPAVSAFAEKNSNYKLQITNKNQISNSKTFNREQINSASKKFINLPRPMIDSDNFDFSFSGLKTALRYALEKDSDWKDKIPEYCAEFQQAVIDVLIHKTIKAAKKYEVKTIMLAGGVSANKELRLQMNESIKNQIANVQFMVPDLKYTTDNAAMIAAAGYFKAVRGEFTPWKDLKVDCNLRFGD